ncbi:hypothetical protein [Pseudonocardia sp. DLS-67]
MVPDAASLVARGSPAAAGSWRRTPTYGPRVPLMDAVRVAFRVSGLLRGWVRSAERRTVIGSS